MRKLLTILILLFTMVSYEKAEPVEPKETNYLVTMKDSMRFSITPKMTQVRADSIINTFNYEKQ